MNNIELLESFKTRIANKESSIYFLTYDTKNMPRAAIKHIYDMALVLKNNGYDSKILVEDKTYTNIDFWVGERYKSIPIVTIKEDKVEINIDDIIVVPEYYSNTLPQLASIKAIKVMLVQQKEYIFETLSIGSKWGDFGFDKVITTTNFTKKYINEFFPESLVYIIPPYIEDIYSPTTHPTKPIISILCRDRNQQRKIISEFYLKFPQLRWITFKDMVQMTYDEFAEGLKECMVSVWIDDESTFGTFPLESMKCGVPVIGKIPNNFPDWMEGNGIWTDDTNNIVHLLGNFVFSWIEGVELTDDVKQKMKETIIPYSNEIFNQNTINVFNSLFSSRVDALNLAINKFKNEQTTKEE